VSLHTNADSKVTDADRRKADQMDRNTERVDKKVAKTGTIGSDKHAVLIDKGADLAVTLDQLRDPGRQEFRPVIPVATEYNQFGGFDHILTPADYSLVKDGKVCSKCLEWQSDVFTQKCTWRGRDVGCGHVRNLELDMDYRRLGE